MAGGREVPGRRDTFVYPEMADKQTNKTTLNSASGKIRVHTQQKQHRLAAAAAAARELGSKTFKIKIWARRKQPTLLRRPCQKKGTKQSNSACVLIEGRCQFYILEHNTTKSAPNCCKRNDEAATLM